MLLQYPLNFGRIFAQLFKNHHFIKFTAMEIWKEIDSETFIEFSYEVSNLGNVRSLNYNRTGKNTKFESTFFADG